LADTILLTGATGLLGRYLIKDLLSSEVPLAVVVRPNRKNSASERVAAIMATWENELGRTLPRPTVFSGDLTAPCLGLSQKDLQWVERHCDLLLHNAASLSFQSAGKDSEPWRTNVEGTSHVLDLCEKTGIHDFHHVSTAYVCGLRTGVIREDELDEGQEFGNDYERSKVEAENLVRNASFLAPPTFYRPSIIIGDSKTGFTSTFHGFYVTLRLAYTLLNSPEFSNKDSIYTTRITLNGNEHKNFVPVDWVSAVISQVLQNRKHHGKTYHLTADTPVTTQTIIDVLESSLDFSGTVLHGADKPIENANLLEQIFYENMQVYDAYWRHDPQFEKSNTFEAAPSLPCPVVDEDLLNRLSQCAIEMSFRWKDRVPAAENFTSLQPK